MFKAGADKIIDATFKGNEARYLNHSCNVKKFRFWEQYEMFFEIFSQIATVKSLNMKKTQKLLFTQKEISNQEKNLLMIIVSTLKKRR